MTFAHPRKVGRTPLETPPLCPQLAHNATQFTGKIPAELSLGVTVALIGGGIVYSMYKTRKAARAEAAAQPAE